MALADSDRLQTAAATLAVVERLQDSNPDEVVGILATADVATSEAAMGECLSKAAELARQLAAAPWDIFEAAARLTGDQQSAADEIASSIRQALSRDEHVIQLAAALAAAQARAVRVLSKPVVPPEPTPRPQAKPGRRVLRQDSRQHLDMQAARDLLARLDRELQEGQSIHFNINWTIEEDGSAP